MLYLGVFCTTEHYLALLAMSRRTDVNKSSGFCNCFGLLKIELTFSAPTPSSLDRYVVHLLTVVFSERLNK